ncbi:hypothetical protein [Psychroserpens sp.]|uniref:hypothetical protein n=1 Tax=Psychroserpens sp. TaxID=2020870 RepID=UPI001B0D5803|nr:hypothetical protein [Psychroserpens sp.]MBO6606703.1 hypothetical protein [Psychroserpens sp.]MBO6632769.1 hypothetical protein [Psychroserpens sp.]MBO6653407.1 hypothetical protein [Psychroserpens sp.]MBO6680566.1 hypothetical protein [Psychroserpens sp.]MBO6750476.1 hypothetical protein [Psychroserpens sp.]
MKKPLVLLFLVCLFVNGVQAQFGSRALRDEQSKKSFVKLLYRGMNDSIVTGYGFPDPTGTKTIVYSKKRPTEATTKDWETVKVNYAEFYYNKLAMLTSDVYDVKYREDKEFLTDTLRVYNLRGKGGGIANGLEALIYENENVRVFESIEWEGFNVYAELAIIQIKSDDTTNGVVGSLIYSKPKVFKRTAKRAFKGCTELLQNINDGAYFPKSKKHIKQLADDYESLCLKS